jgi:hypothetical protein
MYEHFSASFEPTSARITRISRMISATGGRNEANPQAGKLNFADIG